MSWQEEGNQVHYFFWGVLVCVRFDQKIGSLDWMFALLLLLARVKLTYTWVCTYIWMCVYPCLVCFAVGGRLATPQPNTVRWKHTHTHVWTTTAVCAAGSFWLADGTESETTKNPKKQNQSERGRRRMTTNSIRGARAMPIGFLDKSGWFIWIWEPIMARGIKKLCKERRGGVLS
jgi:hypothetical protein